MDHRAIHFQKRFGNCRRSPGYQLEFGDSKNSAAQHDDDDHDNGYNRIFALLIDETKNPTNRRHCAQQSDPQQRDSGAVAPFHQRMMEMPAINSKNASSGQSSSNDRRSGIDKGNRQECKWCEKCECRGLLERASNGHRSQQESNQHAPGIA